MFSRDTVRETERHTVRTAEAGLSDLDLYLPWPWDGDLLVILRDIFSDDSDTCPM